MNILKWLYAQKPFQPEPALQYVPEADLPESWTEEDAKWLSELLGSEKGRKLSARLTNRVIKAAVQATFGESLYENGKARGIALGIKELELHAYVAPRNFASPVRNTGNIEEQPQEDVAAGLAQL